MSIDTLLFATLGPLVDGRAYPDVAAQGSELPRIVHQQIAGMGLAYAEGTLPDNENVRVQVVTWGLARLEVTELAKRVEEAVLAAPGWQAEPLGGRTSIYEPETQRYGARQDFSIWAPR
ncbi:MAG: DUF3168 domain-containing protein [Comamonadaceae bacterium]|nr:MAG: DUF3168 domain-containing protein [Comamonadaceae bacterium]